MSELTQTATQLNFDNVAPRNGGEGTQDNVTKDAELARKQPRRQSVGQTVRESALFGSLKALQGSVREKTTVGWQLLKAYSYVIG